MSDPNTIEEAMDCVKSLTIELLATQRSLLKAYEYILDGKTYKHEIVVDPTLNKEQTDDTRGAG